MAEEQKEQEQAQFALQRIYIKDSSFECPHAPEVFQKQWKPQINLDLNTGSKKIQDDIYEVTLSLTITATNEGETAFLVEIHQAGIFLAKGMEGQALHQTLGAFCPNLLFPYAREAVDNMVNKASFPPLMLAPVNFDAIYQQALQKQAEKAEETTAH